MPSPLSDDDLASSTVEFPNGAGQILALFCPPKKGGPFPALILIHECWGLNDHIKDIAQRLSREGFAVLPPDLFSCLGNPVTRDAQKAAERMNAPKAEVALAELSSTIACVLSLKEIRAEEIGVIAFCMGRTYALLLACRHRAIRAAVPFCGQVPDHQELKTLSAPVLYVWGTRYNWITEEEVYRLKGHLDQRPGAGEVRIYPAGHAFFNNTRHEVYDAVSARDAWKRATAFFEAHLKAS